MEAKFHRARLSRLTDWVMLFCGGGILWLACAILREPGLPLEDRFLGWFFLVFGGLCLFCSGWSIRRGRRVFLRIEGSRVTGFAHQGGRLTCDISRIRCLNRGYGDLTLTLEDGKRYFFTNIENLADLMGPLRNQMVPHPLQWDAGALEREWAPWQTRRTKALGRTALCGLGAVGSLVLFLIFAHYTPEFANFTPVHRVLFYGICAAGAVCLVLMLCFAVPARRAGARADHLGVLLWAAKIAAAPLRSGRCIAMYLDEFEELRWTVFGFPNDGGVFCVAERLETDGSLTLEYESGVLPSCAQLPTELRELWQIPLDG